MREDALRMNDFVCARHTQTHAYVCVCICVIGHTSIRTHTHNFIYKQTICVMRIDDRDHEYLFLICTRMRAHTRIGGAGGIWIDAVREVLLIAGVRTFVCRHKYARARTAELAFNIID